MAKLEVVKKEPATEPGVKVARIEIELEDGIVKVWAGEDALKWIDVIDGVLTLHQCRTGTMLNVPKPTRVFRLPGAGVKAGKKR